MSRGAQVTVAGAGALGLACALALADAGCAVTVCDPAEPLAGASGVAAGMLAPVFEAALDAEAFPHFDILLAARDLWPALAARAGVTLDRSGALAVGAEFWLEQAAAGAGRLGMRLTELPRDAVHGMAPGLSPAFGHALMTREDWRLEPALALAALRAAAEAAGVKFRREAVKTRGSADWLVVATGAGQDLDAVAPELSQMAPIKGHILKVRLDSPSAVVVRREGGYAVPTEGGLAVGATMEPGIGDPTVDPAQAGVLAASGARLFPAVAGAPHILEAGIRAATPDGLPMVGRSVAPGVLLAAGARRNGWLLAPLVARIIAACVTEGEAGPYAARLDPARFRRGE